MTELRRRAVVPVCLLVGGAILAGCIRTHDLTFVNRCNEDVEILVDDGYLYSGSDGWELVAVGETEFYALATFEDDELFRIRVRSHATQEVLSETVLDFEESLLWTDRDWASAGEWTIELSGSPCRPLFPQARHSDDANSNRAFFLLGFPVIAIFVGTPVYLVVYGIRTYRIRRLVNKLDPMPENLAAARRTVELENPSVDLPGWTIGWASLAATFVALPLDILGSGPRGGLLAYIMIVSCCGLVTLVMTASLSRARRAARERRAAPIHPSLEEQ